MVLYDPPTYDVIMSDAPEMALTTGVNNPPEWMWNLHTAMYDMYQGIRALKENSAQEHVEHLQQVKESYEDMRGAYQAATFSLKRQMGVTQEQIEGFQRQVAEDSGAFARQVWGVLATRARDEDQRQAAVTRLNSAVERQAQAEERHRKDLEEARQEIQQLRLATEHQGMFNQNVESWARKRGQQIDNLVAQPLVVEQQLDEALKAQQKELASFVNQVIMEYSRQVGEGKDTSAKEVLKNLSPEAIRSVASSPLVSRPATRAVPSMAPAQQVL